MINETEIAIDPRKVRWLFDYDELTGEVRWRNPNPQSRKKVGALAGGLSKGTPGQTGSIWKIHFNGHGVSRARVAWVHYYGADIEPGDWINHRSSDVLDDRITNLQLVDRGRAMMGRRAVANSASGLKGVHWNKVHNTWVARIRVRGRLKWLGNHKTKEQAHQAYTSAAQRHFGKYAREPEALT